MPLTTDLDTMVDAVRRTANVIAFTNNHPTTRVEDLVNQGLGALSRLCRTANPEFEPIASAEFETDGVSTTFPLEENFRSLLSVEYTDADGIKSWLRPHLLQERAALTTDETVANSLRATSYKLTGTNIELLPLAPEGHTVLYWYATTMTQLTGAAQFNTLDRLDTWVIWWAAREIAMEREAWERHDRLTAKLTEMEAEIRILARSYDLSHPQRVVNVWPDKRVRRWYR